MMKPKHIGVLLVCFGVLVIGLRCGYILGKSNERKLQYREHILQCQMYGDIHRKTWKKILADDRAKQNVYAFYDAVTASVADIRAITFGLEEYLVNSNLPPQVILARQRDELRQWDSVGQ